MFKQLLNVDTYGTVLTQSSRQAGTAMPQQNDTFYQQEEKNVSTFSMLNLQEVTNDLEFAVAFKKRFFSISPH